MREHALHRDCGLPRENGEHPGALHSRLYSFIQTQQYLLLCAASHESITVTLYTKGRLGGFARVDSTGRGLLLSPIQTVVSLREYMINRKHRIADHSGKRLLKYSTRLVTVISWAIAAAALGIARVVHWA